MADEKAVAGNDFKPMIKPFNWKDNLMYNREDETFIYPTRSARCYSYIEEVGLGEMTNKNWKKMNLIGGVLFA